MHAKHPSYSQNQANFKKQSENTKVDWRIIRIMLLLHLSHEKTLLLSIIQEPF